MGFTNPFVTVSHHRAKRELLKLDEAFFKRQFKVKPRNYKSLLSFFAQKYSLIFQFNNTVNFNLMPPVFREQDINHFLISCLLQILQTYLSNFHTGLRNLLLFKTFSCVQVGVVYLKDFQSSEEEIFSNQPDSPRFEDFLRLLGKRFAVNLSCDNLGCLQLTTLVQKLIT